MPSSVLFQAAILLLQQVDREARAFLSRWCGMTCVMCLRLCVPWGKALLPSGSWFPYQALSVGLDKFYMPFGNDKALSQCKFTNIHTYTFYVLHKPQTKEQAFWLYEFPTSPSSSSTAYYLPVKSKVLDIQDSTITKLPF